MSKPTSDEMQKLYENFETTRLLSAVDSVDALSGHLNDGENCEPPEIRDDLLKLHGMAMAVVNNGDKVQAQAFFDLAVDLQSQVWDMKEMLVKIEAVLNDLVNLYPESLSD